MGLLSIGIGNDSIRFFRNLEIVGILPLAALSVEGLALFKQQNYDLQGSAGYQQFLEGTFAGLTLAFGPPNLERVEVPASEAEKSDLELYAEVMKDRLAPGGDLSSEPAMERPLPGEEIIVPGYTVHDGVVVGTVKETAAVPVAGEAVVGTIVHEEHGGLTPSRSPDAAQ